MSIRYAYTDNSASILCGKNSGTITNCNVDATVYGTSAFGGISLKSSGTIRDCISQGMYTLDKKSNDSNIYKFGVGGICASGDVESCTNEAKMIIKYAKNSGGVVSNGNGSNLKNYGKIEFYNIEGAVGGVCGSGYVKNGYNEATISADSCGKVGGVIGAGYGSDLHNNSNVTGIKIGSQVGGIIGSATNSIEYCYNKGQITSDAAETGGIVGYSLSSIYSCLNTGEVISSGDIAGGIVGSYAASTVKCCGNSGDITAVEYSGGIAGHISNSNDVSYCYNKGIINTIGNDSRSGGLAGKFALLRDRKSSILSFYNLGDIISKGYSGGLVGDTSLFINSNLLIKNTYSAASNIEGSCAGGIFGGVNDKLFSLINCYYLNAGAVKGIGNSDDDAGIAKSAVNMKKEAFRDSLGDPYLYVNNDYPVLCWELGLLVIELSKTEIELNEFHKTEQLTAYEMKNDVTWQSSDETVAIVDEKGFVTAVGNGNCVISAIVGESKAECYVTVSFDYYLEESGFRLDVDTQK